MAKEKETDVLIVGGSAAGLSAANSVRAWYPNKRVAVVRNVSYTVIPCGIPYIYGVLNSVEENKISDEGFLKNGIKFIINEVVDIDRKNRTAEFADGSKIKYERLVMAVGSKPMIPPIAGTNLSNVFPVLKDPAYLQGIEESLKESEDVVIIGGGFIGVEMAEQIRHKGNCNVTLIEALPRCLMSCEEEIGVKIEQELRTLGVDVLTDTLVEAISGDGKVKEVRLSDGRSIKADVVILGIGAVPNMELAEKIGLKVDKKLGIVVDEYMRTNDENIFSCGDCCTKVSAITHKQTPVRLASVSALEGKIAGSNLYKLNQKSRGVVGAFTTKVGNISVGTAGFTKKMCKDNNIDYYEGEITAPDRHPGYLQGCTAETIVKLIFEKKTDALIGGHVIGGVQAADMTNILALAVQQGVTVNEISCIQYATHPLLTGSPLVYQVMWAAENALLTQQKAI